MRGVEAVFHEAAIPSVTRSVQDPMASHRGNATATLSVLTAARDAGVRRVVYAGSSSVYGDSKRLPKREDMETRPLSPYAVGKLTGEHYLRIFASLYGLETLTLRYFNVFGPRQNAGSPYSGVISLFTAALLASRRPVIYGDGTQSRDFTYVANVVDANLRALAVPAAAGEVMNVATGRRVTLNRLLATLGRLTGRSLRARYLPPRPGDVRHSLADITLARRKLGYRPRVDFEAGLRETVDWYRRTARR
jgi:UDP-glucose 4-epimerase